MIVRTPLAQLDMFQTTPPRPERPEITWDDRAGLREVEARIRSGILKNGVSRYPPGRSYNGATGEERQHASRLLDAAQRAHIVPRSKTCSICLVQGSLQTHLENYFRPLYARPICSGCHRILHQRFYRHHAWSGLLGQYGYDGAWFTRIIRNRELTTEEAHYLATLDDPEDARQLV